MDARAVAGKKATKAMLVHGPGDRVAVLGCGPIGLLSIQLARLSGAAEILATDVVAERLQAARRMGASQAWNAAGEDVVAAIVDATGRRGVDAVIETAEQAMEVARPGGTVVLVGILVEDRLSFPASVPRRKGLTVKFDRRMTHTYPRCIALAQAGSVGLDALATHHLPLARLQEAFELVITRRDGVLKAMIEVWRGRRRRRQGRRIPAPLS